MEIKHNLIVKKHKKNYEKLLALRIKEKFTKKTENALQEIMVKAKEPISINTQVEVAPPDPEVIEQKAEPTPEVLPVDPESPEEKKSKV